MIKKYDYHVGKKEKIFMKKILCSFLVFMVFIINTGVASAAHRGSVSRSDALRGTTVPVSVVSTVDSDRLNMGDVIPIIVTEDTYIDGEKVFAEGGRGTAEITKVTKSGGHGRAGYIEIKEARIKDVNGRNHNVQLSIIEKGESKRPSAIFLTIIGVALILIPFGLWREGDPAYISGSKVFNAVLL